MVAGLGVPIFRVFTVFNDVFTFISWETPTWPIDRRMNSPF